MTEIHCDGYGDYIQWDHRLEEMENQYSKEYKYFYLDGELLWYFKDYPSFEEGFAALQSGYTSKLDKDEVMLIQNRDEFVAMHARVFMEPSLYDFREPRTFKDAIEPFRASKKKAN